MKRGGRGREERRWEERRGEGRRKQGRRREKKSPVKEFWLDFRTWESQGLCDAPQ